MSSRFARPALLALALILTAAPAFADPLADSIATIDPSVRQIRVPGSWEKDGKKGIYRVVLTRTADAQPTARLFVQWLVLASDGTPSLERSIEISELAALKLDVADFTTDIEGGLTVFLEIAHPAADAAASYELIVDDDGTYRFGLASN
ncbi:hypothetical protein C3941_12530 [Kaistia algarum]|uniref:hypothetical protein n=1 Tax=Kaistia algarum TaxID=2083279 RepID=UPI000CE7A9D9|nr:hypothetical protein [Kaistia algarum]MCX5515177.1 hypothetical protein [Kaistia algarum]PPE79896.1 hypothetical protein C3941_12530 [Kaistia algarum]